MNLLVRFPSGVEMLPEKIFYFCAELYVQIDNALDQKLCIKFMSFFLERDFDISENSEQLIMLVSNLCKKMTEMPSQNLSLDFDFIMLLVQEKV